MPADTLTQVRDMAVAGGMVFLVVAPVAVVCVSLARLLGRRVVPGWRPHSTPWTGFDILFLFFWQQVLTAAAMKALDAAGFARALDDPALAPDATTTPTTLWAMVIAVPGWLVTAWAIRTLVHGSRWVPSVADLPGRVAFGIVAWVVVTPVVFAVNFLVLEVVRWAGVEPDRHPLTRLGVGDELLGRVTFGVVVCLVTPLAEEFIFRGLMVRWAMGQRYRPWVLVTAAGAFAVNGVRGDANYAPVVFVVVLAAGLVPLGRFARSVRTATAVYSSAAVFAAAHSSVWPTPVPLFVLGLALGYLAARTGGIAACVALHGLFNAVTFVYLLRGGT